MKRIVQFEVVSDGPNVSDRYYVMDEAGHLYYWDEEDSKWVALEMMNAAMTVGHRIR